MHNRFILLGAALAFSSSLMGCGAAGDVTPAAAIQPKSVTIADLRNEPLKVDILSHTKDQERTSALVRVGGRVFELAATLGSDGKTRDGHVIADDGATLYEYHQINGVAKFAFSDPRGIRELTSGSVGQLDVEAAALLRALVRDDLGLRTGDGTTPYALCWTDYCVWFVCDQAGSGIGGCSDWRLTGDWCRVCISITAEVQS